MKLSIENKVKNNRRLLRSCAIFYLLRSSKNCVSCYSIDLGCREEDKSTKYFEILCWRNAFTFV